MHKKVFALLSAALVLAAMFTACAKHSKYGKIYVDARGMEHVLVTDAKGETIVDAAGNYVEVMTGSDGKPIPAVTENGTVADRQKVEYQTNPVAFPGIKVSKHTVEDQYCTVDIPKGWSASDAGSNIVLVHAESGARVVIRPNAARTSASAIEAIQEDCTESGVEFEMDEAELDGFVARVMVYTVLDMQFTAYAVNNNTEFATTVICNVDADKADAVSFDEVLQNIHFK